jgi:hypothetical protein
LKISGLAFYIQLSSLRRAAKVFKQRMEAFSNSITSNPPKQKTEVQEVYALLEPNHKTLHAILRLPKESDLVATSNNPIIRLTKLFVAVEQEVSENGKLRHPVVLRIRQDKPLMQFTSNFLKSPTKAFIFWNDVLTH